MKLSNQEFRADLLGGSIAALVLIPRNMAFGLLIFLPFGPEYASLGIVAGLVSLIVSNIVSAPFGSIPTMCLSTFSLSALLLMSLNSAVLQGLTELGIEDPTPTAIALCFMAVFFAGFFQLLFGFLKVGKLAKYIPTPVLAGLINGTGVAIILSQIEVILGGNSGDHSWIQTLLIITVSVVTFVSAKLGSRLIPKIPAIIIGLFSGTGCYYFLQNAFSIAPLGQIVGPFSGEIPLPIFASQIYFNLTNPALTGIVLTVLLSSIAIGAADMMRAAISGMMVDLKLQTRSDFDRELVAEGLGNIVTGIFGGITSTGNATGTLINHDNGGVSKLSRGMCGLVALLVLLFLNTLVAMIPMAVLASIMILLTIALMDFGFVNEFKRLVSDFTGRKREILTNLFLSMLVTALVVLGDLFVALAFGLILSIVLFVAGMTKKIVRDEFGADELPSNVMRPEYHQAILNDLASKIRVLELEGVLFFGTADGLHEHVDRLLQDKNVECIIIDLKRISQIDSTATDIIAQCANRAENNSVKFYVSSIDASTDKDKFPELINLLNQGIIAGTTSIEDALAAAEETLLASELDASERDIEISLDRIGVLSELGAEHIDILMSFVKRVQKEKGEYLIREGDREQIMFFLVKGNSTISTTIKNDKTLRLGTLCAGTVVGEMSFQDDGSRSASVIANDELVCYSLGLDDLNRLRQQHPEIAYEILAGLTRMYAERLRSANRAISRLRA